MKTLLVAALILFVLWPPATVVAQDGEREITPLGDGLYRFRNRFHVSLFAVTGAGVVVTDPINADAAGWLRREIGKLTSQPITHLIYSHSHGDHASGGRAYGDVPNVIAHANAPAAIDGVRPTIRFGDEMSLVVGNRTFELTFLGPGHGTDLIAMVVRPDNVAFVVDAVSAKRLFYRDFPGANVDHWIEQVRVVNTLDFDVFVGGHGPVGDKADVASGLRYLRELRAAVLDGLRAGRSVAELKQSVDLEKYQDWGSYEQWRELNIEGMARHLQESGAL